eukprot:SAG25_NODE_690_length_5919_cov_13.007045_4_plen_54_part_00
MEQVLACREHAEVYWINFSNTAAVDWWLRDFIGTPLSNPLIDGIYFVRRRAPR